jgi:mannitol 2-dehydrogenase
MQHPVGRAFWRRVQLEEVVPLVEAPSGTNALEFWRTVERRLANPSVADPVRRLASMGCTRMPAFLGATLRDRLKAGKSTGGLALAHALWARYCAEDGHDGDAQWERLHATALAARQDPAEWLRALPEVYGEAGETTAVGADAAFRADFCRALAGLWQNGVQKTVMEFVRSPKGSSNYYFVKKFSKNIFKKNIFL